MSETNRYFDDLETRDAEAREADLTGRLPDQLAAAKASAPYFAELLADVEPAEVASRDLLAMLPITRKSDLIERQAADPPLGGLGGVAPNELAYLFQSPGPIYDPGGDAPDFWRFARAFWAGGFRPGDIVHNTFSYHLTPAGKMMESAARAIGCPVFPGGVGNTELQLAAISHIRPTSYVGTPSFLKILLDRAEESGTDASSIVRAGVGGEALPPGLRQELNERGVFVLQSYGTADCGLIAYESEAMEGMILDERIIVEIVGPGSGGPVAEGEIGEVVVTLLNPVYPLVRFATGDLSATMTGTSPCGRTNTRIKGWMGRADQTTKVKGMFVHPSQIDRVVARHPEVVKARLVVGREDGRDIATLNCEAESGAEGLASAIAETLQSVCKVRGRVEIVAPGSLADDGKAIDDIRAYE